MRGSGVEDAVKKNAVWCAKADERDCEGRVCYTLVPMSVAARIGTALMASGSSRVICVYLYDMIASGQALTVA